MDKAYPYNLIMGALQNNVRNPVLISTGYLTLTRSFKSTLNGKCRVESMIGVGDRLAVFRLADHFNTI